MLLLSETMYVFLIWCLLFFTLFMLSVLLLNHMLSYRPLLCKYMSFNSFSYDVGCTCNLHTSPCTSHKLHFSYHLLCAGINLGNSLACFLISSSSFSSKTCLFAALSFVRAYDLLRFCFCSNSCNEFNFTLGHLPDWFCCGWSWETKVYDWYGMPYVSLSLPPLHMCA